MMQRMVRIVSRTGGGAVLLLVGVLATGCVNLDVSSEFHDDGSAQHLVAVVVDRSALAESDAGLASDFRKMTDDLEGRGLAIEPIETEDHLGIRVTKSVANAGNVGPGLNALFEPLDRAAGSEPVEAFSGTFTQQDGFLKTTYTLNLTVDGDALRRNEAAGQPGALPPKTLREFISLTYTAKLPGDVAEHNGVLLPDGRVQWDLPITGAATFTATAHKGPPALLLLTSGGILVALTAASGVVVWQKRQAVAPALIGRGTKERPIIRPIRPDTD